MENGFSNTTTPTLVFGAEPEPKKEEIIVQEVKQQMTEDVLSPEERKMVEAFAKQIDIRNTNGVLQYGVGTQKKIADFSEAALQNVRAKDLGEVGDMLTSVVTTLKNCDVEEEEKGLFSWFRKAENKISSMKGKYEKAEVQVENICEVLEGHQVQLLKDIAILDNMYEQNLVYFKELSMYIMAGKMKLKEAQEQAYLVL